jgi:hypothetical protein
MTQIPTTDTEAKLLESMQQNDRLIQDLQIAQQTIQKLENEKGTLLGEKRHVENSVTAVRNLMDQLKEQYLQEQIRVLNLEDVIRIIRTSADTERNSYNVELAKRSKEIQSLKEQSNIHVGQILKKTQAISYTESLARNIFNIMFALLSDTKTSKKIKEFVGATLTLKELVNLCIINTGLSFNYDSAECQALRIHVDKFDKLDAENVDRITYMYQALWLLSKVVSDITTDNSKSE